MFALVVAAGGGCGSSHRSPEPHRTAARRSRSPIALAELHGRIVLSRRGDIWVANADASRLRRLTSRRGDEFDPSWSPDGSRIAYRDSRRGVNDNDEIYVMHADGSRLNVDRP